MFGRNALSIRRLTAGGMLLILMLAVISLGFLLFTSPASAGPGAGALYETRLLVWNGSAWVKVTKGQLASLHNAATDAVIGGGYGSTGVTISSAGVIQANGAITTDNALTALTAVLGGGYGSTGISTTATGDIQANGSLTVDTNVTIGANKVTIAGATGNTAVQGTLAVYDALTATTIATTTDASGTIGAVTTATYYGKTVFLTHATGGTVTLPDAAAAGMAGKWVRFVLTGNDNLAVVFQETGADDLIAPNNATADSVTFGAGHRIGATVKFLSNGANWIAINENAGCTMTVTDAD